jgi:hypothetical protein
LPLVRSDDGFGFLTDRCLGWGNGRRDKGGTREGEGRDKRAREGLGRDKGAREGLGRDKAGTSQGQGRDKEGQREG